MKIQIELDVLSHGELFKYASALQYGAEVALAQYHVIKTIPQIPHNYLKMCWDHGEALKKLENEIRRAIISE